MPRIPGSEYRKQSNTLAWPYASETESSVWNIAFSQNAEFVLIILPGDPVLNIVFAFML